VRGCLQFLKRLGKKNKSDLHKKSASAEEVFQCRRMYLVLPVNLMLCCEVLVLFIEKDNAHINMSDRGLT